VTNLRRERARPTQNPSVALNDPAAVDGDLRRPRVNGEHSGGYVLDAGLSYRLRRCVFRSRACRRLPRGACGADTWLLLSESFLRASLVPAGTWLGVLLNLIAVAECTKGENGWMWASWGVSGLLVSQSSAVDWMIPCKVLGCSAGLLTSTHTPLTDGRAVWWPSVLRGGEGADHLAPPRALGVGP
jgi:hypothetical protein